MEALKNGIIQSIYKGFSLPVYFEETPKTGTEACFTVEEVETTETPLLNRRWSRKTKYQISYFPKNGVGSQEDCRAKVDALYDTLFLVGDTEKFIGSDMQMKKTEDGISFFVTYAYQMVYEEDGELMERLEHNGEQVIGYEKEQ